MKIFHGGCHHCTVQKTFGLKRCPKCRYFEANWDLPDLNSERYVDTTLKTKFKKFWSKLKRNKQETKEHVNNFNPTKYYTV